MSIVKKFLDQKSAQGLSRHTVKSYETTLKALERFKHVEDITKDDLVIFFQRQFKSDSTRLLYTVTIKTFYKEIGKPDMVDWLKVKKPRETLKSDDILTAEEVQSMIDVSDSFYWKALIAILYESGARISEIQALKWKDLIMTEDKVFMVHIGTTKTSAGYRKMVLPYSTSYLLNLREMTGNRVDDIIFSIKYRYTFDVIAEIGRRAKITKHVHPHAFRHARATAEIQKGTPEPIVRKMLGWSAASTVPSRYIHMSDQDVIDSQMGRTHYSKNGNIKIAEKADVKTAFDEVKAVREENASLKAAMAKQKEENDFILRTLKAKGIL